MSNKNLDRLALLVASGLYSGFAPKAPGTAGSVLACVLLIVFSNTCPGFTQGSAYLGLHLLTLLTCLLGLWSSARVMAGTENANSSDPQFIVIDEWAGIFLTFSVCPALSETLLLTLLGLALFRFFDIRKPGPVGLAEGLPGAKGVMADDLVAGLLAGSAGWLILYLYRSLFV